EYTKHSLLGDESSSCEGEIEAPAESLSAFHDASTSGPGPTFCHLYLPTLIPGGLSVRVASWPNDVMAQMQNRSKEMVFISLGDSDRDARFGFRNRRVRSAISFAD